MKKKGTEQKNSTHNQTVFPLPNLIEHYLKLEWTPTQSQNKPFKPKKLQVPRAEKQDFPRFLEFPTIKYWR